MKKWFPLLFTNFLGVLNDHYLKYLVIFVSVGWLAKEQTAMVITYASGLFVLPYVFLSPYAGWLSKVKYKQRIVERAKFWEIAIVLIASVGFLLNSIVIVLFAVFLMGLQSCLFSPAKYGLIRDIGGEEGISFGTGAMETLTFLGVLIGPALAGYASDYLSIYTIIALLFAIALAGWWVSRTIQKHESTPQSKEESGERIHDLLVPGVTLRNSYKKAKLIPSLNNTIFGLAMFWFIGSLLQMNIATHCPNLFGFSDFQTGLVMTGVALGIAAGCFLSGIISPKIGGLKSVPLAGLGLSLSVTLIYVLPDNSVSFIILIISTAFFAGLFKIPLNTNIQSVVKGRLLGEMLAYNNLVLFIFILLSAGVFGVAGSIFDQAIYTKYVFLLIAICAWFITIFLFLRFKQSSKS